MQRTIVALALGLAALSARAEFLQMPGQNYSVDSFASRAWLQVDQTQGSSWDQVDASWVAQGWRHATLADLSSLVDSYTVGLAHDVDGAVPTQRDEMMKVASLIDVLGGWGPNNTHDGVTYTLTGTLDQAANCTGCHGTATLQFSLDDYTGTVSFAGAQMDSGRSPFVGHFLVKDGVSLPPPPPVPEPASWVLSLLGIAAVASRARR